MSSLWAGLAASVRSRIHELEAPLEECARHLTPREPQAFSADAKGQSLSAESASMAVYLCEMIAQAKPGALMEYLMWLQSRATAPSPHRDNVLLSLDCFERVLAGAFPAHGQAVREFMETARVVASGILEKHEPPDDAQPHLEPLAQEYLRALLATDRDRAWQIIDAAVRQGMPIKDIYLHVFQPTQYEIGRLWQHNRIGVAQEHYCTATTQLIMSRLYPRLFSGDRKDRRFLGSCVGGELHELGARMVADFFEMEGWDTRYLGAGSPEATLLKAVETHQPHVVGLSVTLLAHVRRAEKTITEIRGHFGSKPIILVGGRPFNARKDLWRHVGADGYGPDAQKAVEQAEALVGKAS
ncbi:cobalamin B12-binding domain-containing protein [Desulfosoma sp.]